jgi:hypothetical protein
MEPACLSCSRIAAVGDRDHPQDMHAETPGRGEGDRKQSVMNGTTAIVFPVDVDNTLLDNDHVQNDLRNHLEERFGRECREGRQGKSANDPAASAANPQPDVTIDRIGDLFKFELQSLVPRHSETRR